MASTPDSAASDPIPRVVSCGDIAVDLVVQVDRLPPHGGEVFSKDTSLRLGGSALNTAVALTRLGVRAAVLAQVGNDELGRHALSQLDLTGVDAGEVGIADGMTGVNLVAVTPDGERTMISTRGVNRDHWIDSGWAEATGWLHVSGYALTGGAQAESALVAVELAREREIPVSIDVPSGVADTLGDGLAPTLEKATIVTMGRQGLRPVFAEVDPTDRLLASGVDVVAITAGGDPVTVATRSGERVDLTPPAVSVVDTTAAGDSFMAGLIAGTILGLDVGEMTTLATALGAVAASRSGAGNEDPWELGSVLDKDHWTGVEPSWLEATRRLLAEPST